MSNATANGGGLADVNPIFSWVRLAQRVPVRIAIDHVPPDILLAAGMTATVQVVAPGRSFLHDLADKVRDELHRNLVHSTVCGIAVALSLLASRTLDLPKPC